MMTSSAPQWLDTPEPSRAPRRVHVPYSRLAMHRAVLRLPLRHVVAPQRRSFVSTVLLTRAWENETVAEFFLEVVERYGTGDDVKRNTRKPV